ncbi:COG2141 Coenzyme F420-dependent N5,N10-methylene tetrahydromethanopterin reductase and related flavin-dependent oxidoreductases [Acidimicrobiia bacterium]
MGDTLKIRVGIGLGTMTTAGIPDRFTGIVDRCEELGFDSLWMSERIGAPTPDPLIALAVAAGRTQKLKLGTSVLILPGRNPIVLAKELATLDVLSGGRFLPAVGLGAVNPPEQRAFGVERNERGRRHDEALELMRKCWTGEVISHVGEFYSVDEVQVLPRPHQDTLDVWLGGIAPSELRRVGRIGDGWLPSFCSPADIVASLPIIEQAAADAGRTMDPEHYGALIAYCDRELPSRIVDLIALRRPDVDPRSVVPTRSGLPKLIEEFIDTGVSKFVVLPLGSDVDPEFELGDLAQELLPLEN